MAAKGKIKFFGKIPNYATPEVYNQNEVFVNLTPSGSFDKTILEAMACQTLVLVSNKSFQDLLSDYLIFREGEPEDFKNKIKNIFTLEKKEKENLGRNLRERVIKDHDLDKLINQLIKYIS